MKRYVISIIILGLSLSCNMKPSSNKNTKSSTFNWLIGSWIRINDDNDRKTYEYWHQKSSEVYMGMGCTIQHGDTVFKEDLRIVKIDGKWNFEVTGVHETPTYFLITKLTQNSFSAKNESNEFPKKIEYFLDDKLLVAKISDQHTEIPFLFRPLHMK